MRVLQIGDNALSGHRFNGHDLGKYLRSLGIDSEHLVWLKNHNDALHMRLPGISPSAKSNGCYLNNLISVTTLMPYFILFLMIYYLTPNF